jgi:hypothetical protein
MMKGCLDRAAIVLVHRNNAQPVVHKMNFEILLSSGSVDYIYSVQNRGQATLTYATCKDVT